MKKHCAVNSLLFASLILVTFPVLGQQANVGSNQPVCSKPPCVFVHVDSVSYYDPSDLQMQKPGVSLPQYVVVSNSEGTYLLKCYPWDQYCKVPTTNGSYEFISTGEKWVTSAKDLFGGRPGEKDAFLRAAGGFLGVYQLEAHVPITPGSEVQRLIATCKAKGDIYSDEVVCAKWLNRREEARRAACPDADATVACRSFQELIKAGDFMGDFAEKEHVFTCFRKNEDMFFNLWFGEPGERGWQQDNTKDRTLTQSGIAAFDYYKQGLWSFNLSVGVYGKWRYIPPGPVCNATCRKEATSGNSGYEGQNEVGGSIRIDNERAILSESFDNKSGSRTTHEVIVQLSTGRFTERYMLPKSSGMDEPEESTGRCIILAPLSSQQ
jgi:hypothetical protein